MSQDSDLLQPRLRSAFRDHWVTFLVEGIVLVVLGGAAIIVPPIASLTISIFLGWLFLIGGFIGLLTTYAARHAPGFWWSLLSAFVTIVAGAFLVRWPLGGAVSLTIVLAVFLVADGIFSILFGLTHRRHSSRHYGWLILNGALDLLLAGIIVWAFPASAVWALALIVGIDLLMGGWALISMALAARFMHASP